MPSPFPGMDPYLEGELWPDVHHELISQIRGAVGPFLKPRYVARVELRVYINDDDDRDEDKYIPDIRVETSKTRRGRKKPTTGTALQVVEPEIMPLLLDDEIQEARLEIKHRESGALVAVIEILSPTNKRKGSSGRKSFMDKRREILASDAHWVEIDLLRAGMPSVNRPRMRECDYRIIVSRGDDRVRSRFWGVGLREPLPVIGIPLKDKDPDAPLDLEAVLNKAYDIADYEATIDYQISPIPPLNPDDAKWANALLREKGLRR